MSAGWQFTCPSCGALIEDFSLSDEWFCECGEQGILQDEDYQDENDTEE